MPAPTRISAARSLVPARRRPLTVFCTPAHCFPHVHARSPFTARPLAASSFLLCLTLPPLPRASSSASHFLLHLVLPPLPRASSSASCFLLCLALPLRLASLRFASLHFISKS
ncbi:hypothetical protein B0H13DRAFT_2366399 [Mycena leptocephala]|nr:hypothetical protein B0H13DRAFT_2366399 [Mycena leptocephala]